MNRFGGSRGRRVRLHLNLACAQDPPLVVDSDLEVAPFVHHNDVVRVLIVNDLIGLNARHSNRVEDSFVLPRAKWN